MVQVESHLGDTMWAYDRHSKGQQVLHKMIMKKAKIVYDDMTKEAEFENDTNTDFLASTGSRMARLYAAKRQSHRKIHLDKLVSYVLQV